MTKIKCDCGWEGTDEDILWDWEKEDMSDIGGYCPQCKREWYTKKKLPDNYKMIECEPWHNKIELRDWDKDD